MHEAPSSCLSWLLCDDHSTRSLRMSMHTACTAMLRFSPKLSTFSCVFACTGVILPYEMPAMCNRQDGQSLTEACLQWHAEQQMVRRWHVASCTLILMVLGCASSSWHKFSRMRSLWGDSFGRCKMIVASRLPSSYPWSCMSRTCVHDIVMHKRNSANAALQRALIILLTQCCHKGFEVSAYRFLDEHIRSLPFPPRITVWE